MQKQIVQRRVRIVLDIKIDGQIVKTVPLIHRDILFKLLRGDPYGLRVHIRLVLQEPALPPVGRHILHGADQIEPGLLKRFPPDLLPHKFGKPPHRLRGDNPGIKLRVGQLKRQEFVHVIALFPGGKKTQRPGHTEKHQQLP